MTDYIKTGRLLSETYDHSVTTRGWLTLGYTAVFPTGAEVHIRSGCTGILKKAVTVTSPREAKTYLHCMKQAKVAAKWNKAINPGIPVRHIVVSKRLRAIVEWAQKPTTLGERTARAVHMTGPLGIHGVPYTLSFYPNDGATRPVIVLRRVITDLNTTPWNIPADPVPVFQGLVAEAGIHPHTVFAGGTSITTDITPHPTVLAAFNTRRHYAKDTTLPITEGWTL